MRHRAFGRIGLLSAATLLAAAAGAAEVGEPDLEWRFKVLLDGKEIGYHRFALDNQDQRRVLETEAEFDVKFLFITAFRYRHESKEVWRDGCLASIDAATDNNGEKLSVRGEKEDDGLNVTSSKQGEATLPGCVQSFAYWNPAAVLESPRLLNSQTGEYEEVSVELEGKDQVSIGDRNVDAFRYRLSAKKGDIKLWYSAADSVWLALEAPAKGGRTLRYQPVDVPPAVDPTLMARRD